MTMMMVVMMMITILCYLFYFFRCVTVIGSLLSNVRANVALLQEGVRVHAKVTSKSGIVRFLPGRIVKVTRNSTASSNNNNNSKSSNNNISLFL